MNVIKLSDATEFHVVHLHQDCRGWPVLDTLGRTRGVVADLLIDTENERVTALRLGTGEDLAVESVALRNGSVVVYDSDLAGAPGALPLAPIDPMAPPTRPIVIGRRA